MEGEADRREDGDPPEGQSDGLEGLREEIRERYPESGKEDQGGVPPDSGEASEDVDSAPETKL